MGEPFDLLAEPISIKLFDCIDDSCMDVAAAFVEQPAIGDVVSERVLEGVLQVRKDLSGVEKLGRLQIVQQAPKPLLCQPANGVQLRERDVVPNYRRLFQQTFPGTRQRVNTRG